jgi:flavin-binding protein dodecin
MLPMHSNVYKIIEITGSSEVSIDDAIKTAIVRASQSIRHIGWFEVIETRGHVHDGAVAHFQVTLKIGFRLDEDSSAAQRDDSIPEPGTDALHEGP